MRLLITQRGLDRLMLKSEWSVWLSWVAFPRWPISLQS